MRARTDIALLLGVVGLECSCGASPAPPPARVRARVGYDVHEWGLVRAEAGDALRVGAIAPVIDTMPLVVLKPILYFHADAALTLDSVVVSAPPGGSIAEAWPLVPTGARATWSSVALDPSGACAISPLPTLADPPCSGLGADVCESAGLAVARTSDSACVSVGGTTERFLFYRGRATELTPPLRFERTGGDVRVTNEGDAAIPGTLVRIYATAFGTEARVVAPPAPHAEIMVPAVDAVPSAELDMPASSPSLGVARGAIHASLVEIGLTGEEADAFMRAWDAALFAPVGGTALAAPAVTLAPPAPSESFLYFLPQSATDGVATLTFDPPARTVHRAIAVWSALADTGASH